MAKTGLDNPVTLEVRQVPSSRPRKRATNRRVAPIGYLPSVGEADEQMFSAQQVAALAGILSEKDAPLAAPLDELEAELQQAAWSHQRQRQALPPVREEAGYQLAMIAWLTSGREWDGDPEKQNELLAILTALNPLTIAWLWSGLIQLGEKCPPIEGRVVWEQLPPATLGKAAAHARASLKGGDYPDTDLYCTLLQLRSLFEWATDTKATYWRAVGPIPEVPGAAWETQEIAGSRFGRFALAFFSHVEPELSPARISSAIKADERARKRKGGQSPRDA